MPKSDRGRFSAKRKREAVLRLLRSEDLDVVSREIGVTGATLAQWREVVLEGALGALRTKPADERSERIKVLEQKLGQVVMENEFLNEKIDRMEGTHVPNGYRRVGIAIEGPDGGGPLDAWTYVKDRDAITGVHSDPMEEYALDPRYVRPGKRSTAF